MADTVEVVVYDPVWPEVFEAVHSELRCIVPQALAIEHAGSTSVPGLASKPTIDILLVASDFDPDGAAAHLLMDTGFVHRVDAFAPERHHLFFRKTLDTGLTVHLHVLSPHSTEPDEYLLFRDFLRENTAAADRYQRAKFDLATRFSRDRSSYVSAKEPVVEALLVEARTWDAAGRMNGPESHGEVSQPSSG